MEWARRLLVTSIRVGGAAVCAAAMATLVAVPAGAQAPSAPASGAFVPPAAPAQPMAFPHNRHAAQGLECRGCHEMPAPGAQATFPATATCMTCHEEVKADSPEIQKLAGFHKRGEPVPWARVYSVAKFVTFSHARHVDANPPVTCETCHGNVGRMEVTQQAKEISMLNCVGCHTERSAPRLCNVCHEYPLPSTDH